MTAGTPGFLGRLDGKAKAAQAAEIAFRQTVTAEIARHERQRQFAFRRLGIARVLAAAVADADEEADAVEAGGHALRRELDWFSGSETRTRVLAAARPLILAAWAAVRADGEAADAGTADAVEEAFAAFEAWYEAETGAPFLALLDQEVPETPLVEF